LAPAQLDERGLCRWTFRICAVSIPGARILVCGVAEM